MMRKLGLLAGVLFGLGVAGAAQADCDPGERIVKFSLVTALEGHPKGEAALGLAEAVNAEMNGKLCMEVFGNAELYDDDEVFDALLAGDVQLAAPSASKFGPYSDQLQLFDVPFLFDSALHVLEFLKTDAATDMLSTIEDDGFAVLGFWTNGMYQMSATVPLRKPSDANGLTFRVQSASPSILGLMDIMGAKGVPMPFSKVYDALAAGEVQAQYNTWSNIQTRGFYLHQAAVVETNHGYLGYPVVTSQAFLDSLDSATRDQFLGILALVTHERNRFAFEINQARRQDIIDDDGIIIQLSKAELDVWRAELAPLVDLFRRDVDAGLVDAAISANAEANPF